MLDQEGAASLGGQAWWSLGGLFLVNTPEQRHLGVKDSAELALADWLGSAGFDRPEDHWPRQWAQAYVEFAAGEKRGVAQGAGRLAVSDPRLGGTRRLPGSAGTATRCPASIWSGAPGPGVLTPFVRRVTEHVRTGRVQLRFRHRVTELIRDRRRRHRGAPARSSNRPTVGRGEPSSRAVAGDFSLGCSAVIVTSGGVGGNHDLVRRNWPGGPDAAPAEMLSGVPDSTDGLMLGVTERAGGRVINEDRMWHYPEGVVNHSPVWTSHGIRILSGPSPLWLDAFGKRLPTPLFPGFDALGALRHILSTGRTHSWFLLDSKTIGPEFALSGSEQNPDFAEKSVKLLLTTRAGGKITPTGAGVPGQGRRLPDRADRRRAGGQDERAGRRAAGRRRRGGRRSSGCGTARCAPGWARTRRWWRSAAARKYFGDRRMRTAEPHEMLDPAAGPLIAVRLHVITRKTLGGLETDLSARVLQAGRKRGRRAVRGRRGGRIRRRGMHGYRALEGRSWAGACSPGGSPDGPRRPRSAA